VWTDGAPAVGNVVASAGNGQWVDTKWHLDEHGVSVGHGEESSPFEPSHAAETVSGESRVRCAVASASSSTSHTRATGNLERQHGSVTGRNRCHRIADFDDLDDLDDSFVPKQIGPGEGESPSEHPDVEISGRHRHGSLVRRRCANDSRKGNGGFWRSSQQQVSDPFGLRDLIGSVASEVSDGVA
jgi:hypothetical protein